MLVAMGTTRTAAVIAPIQAVSMPGTSLVNSFVLGILVACEHSTLEYDSLSRCPRIRCPLSTQDVLA